MCIIYVIQSIFDENIHTKKIKKIELPVVDIIIIYEKQKQITT